DIDLTPAPAAPAGQEAPQQPPPQAQQPTQQRKLTEEEKKQIEEINKKNVEVTKENAKIGNLNTQIKEDQEDMTVKNYDAAVQVMQQAAEADNGQHDQVYGIYGDALLGAKKYPRSEERRVGKE